jgi:hypothetical protein
VSDDEVSRMAAPGGAQGYVRIAADLIAATFEGALPDPAGRNPAGPRLPQDVRA